MFHFSISINPNDYSYRLPENAGLPENIPQDPDAFRFLRALADSYAPEDLREDIKARLDANTVIKILKEKHVARMNFYSPVTDTWARITFMAEANGENGELTNILCAADNVSDIKDSDFFRGIYLAEEVPELKAAEEARLSHKTESTAIRQFMNLMLKSENGTATIDDLVESIARYYEADRSYIFEEDITGQYVCNTYEWCAEGVTPEKENLSMVPAYVAEPWIQEFRKKGSFYISCNDEYAKKEPIVYEVLEPQGISSLMAAPLMHGSDIIGFLGVDNPKMHIDHELFLSVAASVLNHEILAKNERKIELEYEKALEHSAKAAQAANEAKTSFLFNMSHDIRTPINAIMGFRDLLERHQEEPARRADYLAKIAEASNVLLSIINNVLEMARIEKGTIKIEENTLDANRFVHTIDTVFREMMEQKQLTFTSEVKVRHSAFIGDEVKLREIYYNLLSNAYKYTKPGGSVCLSLEELPSEKEGELLYQITVADTGIGMSEEFLKHIFEEFSRENNTTRIKVEGTGLGMPIVKRFVDQMRGTIEVESKQGVGSVFRVTIPHRIAEAIPEAAPTVGKIDRSLFRGKNVLLVEDNDFNAEIAAELLIEEGFKVERAEDGVICLEKLKNAPAGQYDVILMDIQMPRMNGYEATRAIRALEDPVKRDIKILAVTANAFEEDKKAALEAGMNAHIAKPINTAEIFAALSELVQA